MCTHWNIQLIEDKEAAKDMEEHGYPATHECWDCGKRFILLGMDEYDDLKLQSSNAGCIITCEKLEKIVDTKEKRGWFGSVEMERLAQKILKLIGGKQG